MMNSMPKFRDFVGPALALLILTVTITCAARGPRSSGMQSSAPGQAQPRPLPSPQNPPDQPDMSPPGLTPKQQRELLKSRYERLRQEATQLSDLAKSLQQDLDKSNSDVLSLGVVDKADKIEKLAKKIKNEAVQ
jgi:hypothetical protein